MCKVVKHIPFYYVLLVDLWSVNSLLILKLMGYLKSRDIEEQICRTDIILGSESRDYEFRFPL